MQGAYLPGRRSPAKKTITLMFSSDSLEILSDGTYFDLNGSIGIIREPNLGQNETEFRSSFCLIFVNTS